MLKRKIHCQLHCQVRQPAMIRKRKRSKMSAHHPKWLLPRMLQTFQLSHRKLAEMEMEQLLWQQQEKRVEERIRNSVLLQQVAAIAASCLQFLAIPQLFRAAVVAAAVAAVVIENFQRNKKCSRDWRISSKSQLHQLVRRRQIKMLPQQHQQLLQRNREQ